MARRSFQKGWVSDGMRTSRGVVYKIRYRLPGGDGKWIHKTETLYDLKGKKAARDVLDERIKGVSRRAPDADKLTLDDFVQAHWRPYLTRKKIKPSTIASYESALDAHITPSLGAMKLVQIAPLHIENFVQEKTRSGRAAKTVRNLVAVLQSIFSLAVDDDLIEKSPVRDKHKPTASRKEKSVWSGQQVRAILNTAPQKYRALFTTAALTGARLGELLALQWKHINLREGTLLIEQSLWHGKLVPPKTANSVRTIRFANALGSTLAAHFNQAEFRTADSFVFCKPGGSPLHPDVLRKDVLYPVLDRLGIERIKAGSGFHCFRHSAGSFVNAQTGNLKLAQELLGHSSFGVTADIYTHVGEDGQRDAASAVERQIFGDSLSAVPNPGSGAGNGAVN
jgi:integrase